MARDPLSYPANCSTGLSLLGVGAVGVAAGISQGNAGLVAFSACLVVGPLVLLVFLRRSVMGLHLSRCAPESAFEDEAVELSIEVENSSGLPVFFPRVVEVFPPELHSQKELLYAGRVMPEERVSRSYRGYCLLPRGNYTVGPTAIRLSDPFGWFELRKLFASRHPLKVYPKIHRFGFEDRVGRCVTHLSNPHTHNSRGDSSEFLTVREYQTGDSPRRIHWGLSAHLGYPVVRQFARAATGDLAIFIDLSEQALVGLGRNSSIEQGVKIAAAAASHSLRKGRRVQLIAGGRAENFVPPRAGAPHLPRILDALVDIRPTSGEPQLPELLASAPVRLGSGVSLLVTVSPYLYENDPPGRELTQLLGPWTHRGHRIVAVLFDEETFPQLRSFRGQGDSARTQECAGRLRNIGVETFIVPYVGDLELTFSSPAR